MSSTWVAEFDNEKDHKHFVARFDKIAPGGGNIIVPKLPENPEKVRLRGAWVDLDDTVYDYCEDFDENVHGPPPLKDPAWAVSFDIAIWDDWTKAFILCLMHEMCKRYSFVEIGCDSADLVSAENLLEWRVFGTPKHEIEYYKASDPEELHFIMGREIKTKDFDKLEKEIGRVEKAFREAAKRFFDGDASDLILSEKGEPQSDFRAEIKGT